MAADGLLTSPNSRTTISNYCSISYLNPLRSPLFTLICSSQRYSFTMAEQYETENTNGEPFSEYRGTTYQNDLSFYAALRRLISDVFVADRWMDCSFFKRIKISVVQNAPSVREGCRNTGRDVLLWTRRGSPLRALLVVSVGTIALLALTGLLVFMLFFLAATANAVIISLLVSLVAAGGFLALFFASITAIYIGALLIAVFVISTTTISAIIAALIATGWIGFFWVVWLATRKSLGLAKHSLKATSSAFSAYSSARHARRGYKVMD